MNVYTKLFLLFYIVFNLSSCWVFRAYKVRHLKLTDHEKLPSVTIPHSANRFIFHTPQDRNNYETLESYVDSILNRSNTAAFLIFRNDTIIYEKYFMGFNEHSLLPANSMAKSFTGTLVGIALHEGKIQSDKDPITRYLPELEKRDERFNKITIRHLLDMRSGLDFKEYPYNLRSDAIKVGFRRNLEKHILKVGIAEPPGRLKYQSINSQLLGIIVERATGEKLQDYLANKLWIPMGTESIATWNVDSKKRKHVITSAGLNAIARDFAKIGRLYIQNGRIGGQQLLSSSWVQDITSVDTLEKYQGYKSHWWNRRLSQLYTDSVKAQNSGTSVRFSTVHQQGNGFNLNYRSEAFSANGFLNQIIYVHPRKKIIIVRLGESWPNRRGFFSTIYSLGERL